MNSARSQARQSLPHALRLATLSNGKLSPSLGLKVAVHVGNRDRNDTEVIWVSNVVQLNNRRFTAKLANDPQNISNKKRGSKIRFDLGQISDWSLPGADGKMYGHFTTRVMLEHIPDSTRAQLAARLQPKPTPSNW